MPVKITAWNRLKESLLDGHQAARERLGATRYEIACLRNQVTDLEEYQQRVAVRAIERLTDLERLWVWARKVNDMEHAIDRLENKTELDFTKPIKDMVKEIENLAVRVENLEVERVHTLEKVVARLLSKEDQANEP